MFDDVENCHQQVTPYSRLKANLHNKNDRKKTFREHRCGAGQTLSEGQVRIRFFTLERQRGSIHRTSICESVSPFIVVESWLFFLLSKSFPCGTPIQILQSVMSKDFPFLILGFFQAIEISDHGPSLCLSAMGLQSAWDYLYTGPTVPICQAH